MSETLVISGPGSPKLEKKELAHPVCLRMIGDMNKYDVATDSVLETPEPICRLDVLIKVGDHHFEQRHIDLHAEKKVPPSGGRIGQDLWLFEPHGLRSASMLVDKDELVTKLRALADDIERLP